MGGVAVQSGYYFFANAIDKGLRCSGDCFHIHVPVQSEQPQTRSGSSISALFMVQAVGHPGNRILIFAEVVQMSEERSVPYDRISSVRERKSANLKVAYRGAPY